MPKFVNQETGELDAGKAMNQAFSATMEKMLDEAQIPARLHFKVIEALHKAVQKHGEANKVHEEQMRKVQEDHKGQLDTTQQELMKHQALRLHGENVLHAFSKEVERITKIKEGKAGAPGRDGQSIQGPRGPQGEPGRDGKDAPPVDHEKITEVVIKKLKGKPVLDVSTVKGLQTFLFNGVKYKVEELMHGGGSSSGSSHNFAISEVVGGSGTSWTLAHTPIAGTVALFANGQRLAPTTDYTISGTGITTVLSWTTGTILADYQY